MARMELSSESWPKATCFFVGPQKTATTWLQPKISNFKGLSLPTGTKETFFFDRFPDNGIGWYLSLFNHDQPMLCEVAPSYFSCSSAIEGIFDCFPSSKILITLRAPVERSLSHFRHLKRYGLVRGDLEANLDHKAEHISSSLYSKWIPEWQSRFAAENVMLIDAENFKSADSARHSLNQIADFIGTPRHPFSNDDLSRRIYEGGGAGNPWLAGVASRISMFLKKRKLYALLQIARQSPLYTLAYGSGKKNNDWKPNEDRLTKLEHALAPETEFYRELFNRGE